MDISTGILRQLMQAGEAVVPHFGTFFTKKEGARYDAERNKLLPPGQRIFFRPELKPSLATDRMEMGTAASAGNSTVQTDYWKKMLRARQPFTIPGVGSFDAEGDFSGELISGSISDFFGLEEIAIGSIQSETPNTNNIEKPKKSKSVSALYWIFLVALPAAIIIYLAATQSELLFGKRSFPQMSVKKSSNTQKNTNYKNDSTAVSRDSVRITTGSATINNTKKY